MAFLDNSGDIILDAVLTDAGRQRMARGEFKIVKFAFADEEINYELFQTNHPSGSAFSDLEIMQTPILEAFTNNTSLMKTKLLSLSRNNILYLPIFRVNDTSNLRTEKFSTEFQGFFVTADSTTTAATNFNATKGIFPGTDLANKITGASSQRISIDQGMDTGGVPPITEPLPSDLVETAFLIRIDDRLLSLHGNNGTVNSYPLLARSFVDDDAIATYYVSTTSPATETNRTVTAAPGTDPYNSRLEEEMFDGPLGTRLRLMVQPSPSIQQSDALFDELGTSGSGALGISPIGAAWSTHKYIDTILNVVGVTTGYSIDIPIRIVKKTS